MTIYKVTDGESTEHYANEIVATKRAEKLNKIALKTLTGKFFVVIPTETAIINIIKKYNEVDKN